MRVVSVSYFDLVERYGLVAVCVRFFYRFEDFRSYVVVSVVHVE